MIHPLETTIYIDSNSWEEYNTCIWAAQELFKVNKRGYPASSRLMFGFTTVTDAQNFRRAMTDPLKDLYSDKDSRLNTVVAPDKYNYWRMIRKMRDEWAGDRANLTTIDESFMRHVSDRYGIKMSIDEQTGGVTAEHEIVDEQKYLIALLKFK